MLLARFASIGTPITFTARSGAGPNGVKALCKIIRREFGIRAASTLPTLLKPFAASDSRRATLLR
jgi:hypothetical protein